MNLAFDYSDLRRSGRALVISSIIYALVQACAAQFPSIRPFGIPVNLSKDDFSSILLWISLFYLLMFAYRVFDDNPLVRIDKIKDGVANESRERLELLEKRKQKAVSKIRSDLGEATMGVARGPKADEASKPFNDNINQVVAAHNSRVTKELLYYAIKFRSQVAFVLVVEYCAPALVWIVAVQLSGGKLVCSSFSAPLG